MKSDAIAYGVAGMLFGLIAGWAIGSQQPPVPPAPPPAAAAARPADSTSPPPAVLDEAKVNAFKAIIDKDPKNAEARVQLGNLYFDAERWDDASKSYEAALKLAPNDINVST